MNAATLLTITPLTTFYVLKQWPGIVATVDDWLPRDHADTVRGIMRDIDVVLKGFLHGSVLVCAALGTFYGIALSLAGLDYGLTIGLLTGLLSFIPYVGTIFGLAASVGVAFLQFWPEWIRIAVILGIFLAGQLLADYVLTPRIMGSRLAVHPLWLIFGLFAGGALFGFVGLLLSVPATAAGRRPGPLLHPPLQGIVFVPRRRGKRPERSEVCRAKSKGAVPVPCPTLGQLPGFWTAAPAWEPRGRGYGRGSSPLFTGVQAPRVRNAGFGTRVATYSPRNSHTRENSMPKSLKKARKHISTLLAPLAGVGRRGSARRPRYPIKVGVPF